jgi:ABC-2 type transport system ATP-binding protein
MTAASNTALLQVAHLNFSYQTAQGTRHVFTDWSADFQPGLTWLQGANGSGKSTLLKLIAGALPPSSGQLRLAGELCAEAQPLAYRREVFWCGPGPVPLDHLRPPEYFGFLQTLYPRFDAAALPAHIAGLGLPPSLGSRLSALSTGTQRKVWLVAALVAGTRLNLLDEPYNALDAASLAYLRAQLAACAADAQRGWIVTSHEPLGPASATATVLNLSAASPPASLRDADPT